jgi:hypothetical protein
MSQSLQQMIDAHEELEFDKWFRDTMGEASLASDESVYRMMLTSWKARAAKLPKCHGVTDDRCDYLSPCTYACNKCGNVHNGKHNVAWSHR